MPLAPKQQLFEYRIASVLGQGAFGIVYLAHDMLLDRSVAIKELTITAQTDEVAFNRFIQEARAAGGLNHPHIVIVYALKVVEPDVYLVMEYLPRGSLRTLLEKRGSLSVEEAVHMAADVCEGLAAAHAKGIVHRDVKPENILLAEDGRAKIGDFGIARVPRAIGGYTMTRTGFQPGTLVYMSPEQIRGQRVDERSDVYGVGVVLYEMLTGRQYVDMEALGQQAREMAGSNVMLFQARLYELLAEAICEREPEGVCKVRPEVPEWVGEVVAVAMAKRTEERLTAKELAMALRSGEAMRVDRVAYLGDEAHHLEDATTYQLSFEVNLRSIQRLLSELSQRQGPRRYVGYLAEVMTCCRGAVPEAIERELESYIEDLHQEVEAAERSLYEFFDALSLFLKKHSQPGGEYDQSIRLTSSLQVQTGWADVEIAGDNFSVHLFKLSDGLKRLYSGLGDLEGYDIPEYEDLLQGLLDYHQRLEDAIHEFQAVLHIAPNSAGAHYHLGLAYARQGRWDDAIREWQAALRINPNLTDAHVSLGVAYSEQLRVDEAIREFQAALRINPDYAEAHYNLGLAYHQQGRLDEAIREFQAALRVNPNLAGAHSNLGVAYGQQGRLDDEIREYQAALRINPNLAEAHGNLGLAYYQRGRLDEAIREFRDALHVNPNYAEAHLNLGGAYYQQGRLDEAIRECQTALRINPNLAKAHLCLGLSYKQQGRLDEAIREYQIALRINPNLTEAHGNLGQAHAQQGRLDEAIREYQAVLRIDPDDAKAHYNLGVVYEQQGRLDEAVREYQAALCINPDYAEAHLNLGAAYGQQGRLDDEIREYQAALRINPDLAEAHNNLGVAYGQQGRLDEAIREFQAALCINPNYAEAHYNLGVVSYQQGQLDEAIHEAEAALRLGHVLADDLLATIKKDQTSGKRGWSGDTDR